MWRRSTARRRRNQHRLAGLDGDANCAREIFPEFGRRRVRWPPLLDDSLISSSVRGS
jgi:hypothetical protein